MAVLLTLGAHAEALGAGGKASGANAEEAVRAAERARAQALLRADTTALSRLVADEFIEVSRTPHQG